MSVDVSELFAALASGGTGGDEDGAGAENRDDEDLSIGRGGS